MTARAASGDIWKVMSTALLREAVGVPDDWMLAGHIVVGWPKGKHGPLRRRPVDGAVNVDHWNG